MALNNLKIEVEVELGPAGVVLMAKLMAAISEIKTHCDDPSLFSDERLAKIRAAIAAIENGGVE